MQRSHPDRHPDHHPDGRPGPHADHTPDSEPAANRTSTGTLHVAKGPTAPGTAPSPPGEGLQLPLPHEQDQSTGSADEAPRDIMQQAKRDLDAGLVDTDMRATAGMDAERRRRLVPGPGGVPPKPR